MRLSGCYTALVTPFSADGTRIDLARFEEQIRFQRGVSGVVPCGTTGESPTLTTAEQVALIETAVRVGHAEGMRVIAGAGSNATAHAIELHRAAHAAGADASLQVSPYYNKPSQEGLYRHFTAIADSCDLPIVLYDIPGRCAVALAPETTERLSRHPNIVGIKVATGNVDSASEIRRRCGITMLSGDDALTIGFAAVGASGVVSVVSNLLPRRVQELCEACARNDFESARAIHEELLPLSRGLLSLDTNPVPVKAAMEALGRDSGAVRLPLCRVSAEVAAKVRALLPTCARAAAGAGA